MNLYQKLIEIKKTVPYLQKSTKGYQYSYVSGTDLLERINKTMNEMKVLLTTSISEHSMQIVQATPTRKDPEGLQKDYVVQSDIVYTWINAEDPTETLAIPFAGYGKQNDPSKAFGSALTYSERYFLLKFFNIPTDSDDPDKHQQKTTEPLDATERKAIQTRCMEKALKINDFQTVLIDGKIKKSLNLKYWIETERELDLILECLKVASIISPERLKSIEKHAKNYHKSEFWEAGLAKLNKELE